MCDTRTIPAVVQSFLAVTTVSLVARVRRAGSTI